MKVRANKGFTLIELMIVVAIVGILAALALPAYMDYIARSQAAEGTTLLMGIKNPVVDYYSSNGIPPTVTQINARTSGKYIGRMTADISTGTYTVTFKSAGSVNSQLAGKTIDMVFNTTSNSFAWSCGIPITTQPIVCR